MHLARSGRVIIRLSKTLEEGKIVCNELGEKVARVTEIIGPVSKPYASGIPLTDKLTKYLGKKIFALDAAPATNKKFRRKRK
jgi:RNA-binding protein